MSCTFCGRHEDDCPNGIWRGSRTGHEGICRYCCRLALRALDPLALQSTVIPFTPRRVTRPEPPGAA